MNKKKILATLLVASFLLSLTGCTLEARNKVTDQIKDRIEDMDLDEYEYEETDELMVCMDEMEDGFYLDLTDEDEIDLVIEEFTTIRVDLDTEDLERFILAILENHDDRISVYSFQFENLDDAEDFYDEYIEYREDVIDEMTEHDIETFEDDNYQTYVAMNRSRHEILVYDYEITGHTVTIVITGTMDGQLPGEAEDYFEAGDRDELLEYLEDYL